MISYPLDNIGWLRKAARGGLLLVIAAAIIMEATNLIQYFYARKGMMEEASLRAQTQMEATRLKILDVIDQAEATVRSTEWVVPVLWEMDCIDSLPNLAALIVRDNPVIIGSTVAMVPGYNAKRPLYAPYAHIVPGTDSIAVISLATPEYDYPSQEWFTQPIELGEGYWSEPYLDEGGGDILMTTYSIPVRDKYGEIAAVLTADISLDWLTELVGDIEVYPSAFSILLSRKGKFMVCPPGEQVMLQNIQDALPNVGHTASLKYLSTEMLAGHSGSHIIPVGKMKEFLYYAPIEQTGWSMSTIIPSTEIFKEIKKVNLMVGLLQLLCLLMLLVILRSVIKSQMKNLKLADDNNRMESELKIARGIQMSMLPKTFPPFPERGDIDMYATLVPAKEVSGDLYDFFIRDEKLFFCIGDVSGKGVPASLVMAVTRSLFRTIANHESSPQHIITSLNDSMSDMNESSMFVTFFCGILDLTTGHLRYCNAGHNAPILLSGSRKGFLPVEPNLALGVLPGMAFQEQETDLVCGDTLFLYTDGLTEAENISHEMFGESRRMEVLSSDRNAKDQLTETKKAITGFVGNAAQSDDLTLLCFRYLNTNPPDVTERHLILHNDIQQIPQLADFVNIIAEEKKLDQSLAMALNLALEEAVINVIMYTRKARTVLWTSKPFSGKNRSISSSRTADSLSTRPPHPLRI